MINDSDSVPARCGRSWVAKCIVWSDSYRTSLSVRADHSTRGGKGMVEQRRSEECQGDGCIENLGRCSRKLRFRGVRKGHPGGN